MAKGYGALIDVFGGPQSFLQFRMMESGTYEKLAKANGQAINGLQPKITTWSTGRYHIPSSLRTGIDNLLREWTVIRRFNGPSAGHHAESSSSSKHHS